MSRAVGGPVAAVLLAATLAACASPTDVASPGGVVIAMAEESFPSTTAADWVTYADHVVVVTAVDEDEVLMAREDDDGNPPGERSFRRDMTLQVDDLVWSAPEPRHRAPSGSFVTGAPWTTVRAGVRTRVAIEDTPRIEVGHTYVVALVWRPAVEDPTAPSAAHWAWLGMDALLPYDDAIGVGELEGTVRTEPLRVAEDDPQYSFEDAMAGRSVADLVAVLTGTNPVEREEYG
ncbi:hypothetical protein [Krasilnikoviella flava]|uniref:Lipoprotein n=1 Tax=Krasilnikoviella flava TaxID=526729 RepID=A0A1T5ILY9_9MICO|nr:hypothetical protein [Krasilnikoviella flava]SKC40186.1 hypothetical protein SAMN04324258_0681 [Krasilnikoviella flava]